jgi:hypothetical protein
VCLMECSLYGFMQSGCNWAQHLDETLGALHWACSCTDPTIRICHSDAGTSIIGVYTDNIEGISTSTATAEEAPTGIKSAYGMADCNPKSTPLPPSSPRRNRYPRPTASLWQTSHITRPLVPSCTPPIPPVPTSLLALGASPLVAPARVCEGDNQLQDYLSVQRGFRHQAHWLRECGLH